MTMAIHHKNAGTAADAGQSFLQPCGSGLAREGAITFDIDAG